MHGGTYALDTDSTLVMLEDSQVPAPTPAMNDGEEPPLARILFPDEEEKPGSIDLCTPAKQPVESRPVARPLAALKEKLAISAASMRARKAAAESKVASSAVPDAKSQGTSQLQNTAESEHASSAKIPDAKSPRTSPLQNTAESEHAKVAPCFEEGSAPVPDATVEMAEDDTEFLTRRQQLQLQPKPKAKGKAKAKSTGSKDKPATKKSKAAKKGGDDQDKQGQQKTEDVAAEDAGDEHDKQGHGKTRGKGKGKRSKVQKIEEPERNQEMDGAEPVDSMAKDDAADAAPARKKARGNGDPQEAKPKAAASDRRSSETCQARQTLRVEAKACRNGKSIDYMTPKEIMDSLQHDDTAMQIVIDQITALGNEAPTKENQEKLPSYQYWQLSTYWSRGSVGAIRRTPSGPKYVGTFASGGSVGMAVALESMDHFAAGLYTRPTYVCYIRVIAGHAFDHAFFVYNYIVYIYAHIHIYIHIYIRYVYIYIYIYVCVYACVCMAYIYIYTYVREYICIYT